MRLLHTSDWHLGHMLGPYDRMEEHDAFLEWLLQLLESERVDVLLVAGDIFDQVNPPASAQRRWYSFLGKVQAQLPQVEVIAIGGNHDSAARLDAPNPLLAGSGTRIIGGLPVRAGAVIWDELLIPLTRGEERVWVAAMPFLRLGDLPAVADVEDPWLEGWRALIAEMMGEIDARRAPDEPLIWMGHLFWSGATASPDSERVLLRGTLEALPVDLFPPGVQYGAFGHLHRPQEVGTPRLRYAGSPLPLSFSERAYPHQVVLLETDGAALRSRAVRVPLTTPLLRVPAVGTLSPELALAALAQIPDRPSEAAWPYLEVAVQLDHPDLELRGKIDTVLTAKAARLVKVLLQFQGDGGGLVVPGGQALGDLEPAEVFAKAWFAQYGQQPDEQDFGRFDDILRAVERDGGRS